MIGHIARSLVVSAGLFALAGCASTATEKIARAPLGAGEPHPFNAAYEPTAMATMTALNSLGVVITDSRENAKGIVYTIDQRQNFLDPGGTGRIWVKRSAAPPTLVYLDWQNLAVLQLSGMNAEEFAAALYRAIAQAL